jgi:hypothetical protein
VVGLLIVRDGRRGGGGGAGGCKKGHGKRSWENVLRNK